MTEIQFLLDLILTGKLSKSAKEKCLARIGEVESNLGRAPAPRPINPIAQPPSTQRLIDQQSAPIVGPINPEPIKVDRSTGTAMRDNGDGTFSKRKW